MADIIDSRGKGAPSAAFSRESAFHAARSHSRLVRFLKFAVPTVAVLGMASFVFFAWFNPFRAENVTVNVGQVGVDGGKLVMELPHLTGFNKRQQSYNVTAKTASQKIAAPGLIDLTHLDAVITMVDKSETTMTADGGKFNSDAEILSLQDNVKVKSTKGYDALLQSGTIDFKAGTVKSSDPVTVNLANGSISGNGIDIVDGGGKITFQGGVTAHFRTPQNPQADASPAAAAEGQEPAEQTGSTPLPTDAVQGGSSP
ncbi:LPS export ABC transporter periplasmic protein LptC [Labrys monachus]|uniref:Lipopolysaccharide export system protein LptC n=1 Tax=Labrys monachus TaxID=217067 RepID=A0ABU0FN58_9HYPH|nr:LPS export ABC transporter periplasmic protein LptC [Labrys monachus]MDQ0395792.1 lipopolysaccharide export system protein LptC [Labrys monachus]